MGAKFEITKAVAEAAGITNKQASAAIHVIIEHIKARSIAGEKTCLREFGTFLPAIREARTAHNPRNGQIIECEARRIVKFKPNSGFRDAIQDKFREEMKTVKQQKAKKQKKTK